MISKSRKEELQKFKMEAARELGIDLKDKNGNITQRQYGSIGGNMVKKMIADYEKNLK